MANVNQLLQAIEVLIQNLKRTSYTFVQYPQMFLINQVLLYTKFYIEKKNTINLGIMDKKKEMRKMGPIAITLLLPFLVLEKYSLQSGHPLQKGANQQDDLATLGPLFWTTLLGPGS